MFGHLKRKLASRDIKRVSVAVLLFLLFVDDVRAASSMPSFVFGPKTLGDERKDICKDKGSKLGPGSGY